MSIIKSYQLKIIIALNLVWLCGCTFTQSYRPAFNNSKANVLDSIKNDYGFSDITFKAEKRSGSSGTSSDLIVRFVNGKNIPVDTVQMMALEKKLGSRVKTILKTPNEFDTYQIMLSTVTIKKGNFADVTTENYTSHDFKPDDL